MMNSNIVSDTERRKKMKKLFSWILMFIMTVSLIGCGTQKEQFTEIDDGDVPLAAESDSEAIQFAKNMGSGWNLGNSLCCVDNSTVGSHAAAYYEKLWGNLVTTQNMIDALKESGFRTIRIPVSYRNHIDSEFQIEEAWLNRVKEVVDYAMANDMYCVINLHHENFLVADTEKQQIGEKGLQIMWTQIAKYFSSYDEHLIFEGFNEVTNSKGQWDSADTESYQVVNAYNQVFVDAVRACGGNNSSRFLIVNTYAAKATASVIKGFVLPNDSVENRLIVGAHVYEGIDTAITRMGYLNQYFIQKGIPVFIGEWGQTNSSSRTEAVRVDYAKRYLEKASEYGIPCAWWDDGGNFSTSAAVSNYAILKRSTSTWYFDDLASAIVQYGTMQTGASSDQAEENVAIEPIENEEKQTDSDDVFGMKDFSNWQSGAYNYYTGKHESVSARICLNDYQKVQGGESYTAIISMPRLRFLIREIDASGKVIGRYNLANGDQLVVGNEATTIAVSVYDTANKTKTFDAYKKLFDDGLDIYLQKTISSY